MCKRTSYKHLPELTKMALEDQLLFNIFVI
jgi:hypothetical protein